VGNNSINAWSLKSIIKTHETGWLSWLLRDDNYTQEQLEQDRVLIQQYYANHGFPDAQVTSAVAEYNAERKGYFITYTIVEGDHYSFGKIGVETSINGLDANNLTNTIRTRQGDRFSAAELARSAQDMAVEATNLGYPFADVRPRVERDPATGTFAVTYLVDEGQHLYVERINITGNTKTRDFVIRRELGFAEGDPFSRALVAQGKANVEALGFFDGVDPTGDPGGDQSHHAGQDCAGMIEFGVQRQHPDGKEQKGDVRVHQPREQLLPRGLWISPLRPFAVCSSFGHFQPNS